MTKLSDQIAGKPQGFTPASSAGGQSKAAPAPDGQKFALQHAIAAEQNLTAQIQAQVSQLSDATDMLKNAAAAVVEVEKDIFSGNYFQRQLAELRSQQVISSVEDVPATLEFEALTTLEAMAKPVDFPSVESTIKAISPAEKKQLDRAVLGPAK